MRTLSALFLTTVISVAIFYGFKGNDKPDPNQIPGSRPESMLRFYENLHHPYGTVLPQDVQDRILRDVNNTPSEISNSPLAVNSWVAQGPYGMNQFSHPGSYYSGRILDIEVDNTSSTRIAAASGGLWGFAFIFPIPLSDGLNTMAISTLKSKPGDANTIFVGTGEYGVRSGTGLWKTTNAGITWSNVALSPTPTSFFRLRYDPVNSNIMHLATSAGYYKSVDGGATFTRYLTGYATDIAVNPSNNQVMFTSIYTDGIYKSVNGGANWTKLTVGGIPTTNVGRVAISIAPSSTNTVYFNIARNDNNLTLGIYKTTDAGSTFTNMRSADFMNGQGWYNNSIGVCPTNPNIVIAGGMTLLRTSNGGTSWNNFLDNTDPLYDPNNNHADQHSVTWGSASTVWVGSDGGMSYSADAGLTWSTSANLCPITQYVNVDVQGSGQYMLGGSQDNSISGTTNGGSNWWFWIGGDGGGVAIDPVTPSKIAVTNGYYNGSWAWRRLLTTNNGSTWSFIDNGVDPATTWYNKIRNDKVDPVYLYNNAGAYVYQSTNYGTTWTKLNSTAFPVDVYNLNVSRYASPLAVIYAPLSSTTTGQRLRVYDASAWTERSTGFPSGVQVQTVAQHPSNTNYAYALMNGLGSTQKVFRTTNRGVTWTDITGNLPNVPMTDLIPHPTDNNKLYLGTEFGCYKTSNGGTNWVRWNNGMPQANIISEMNYIDSIAANGKFYVVAGTYGRGFWTREISGDDPIGVFNGSSQVANFELKQNYPNPFNPSTEIKFALPSSDIVTLKVYDITGKEVATLLNGKMDQGIHSITFNASGLSSGIYFYRITTSKFTDVKKMSLIK